MQTMVKRSDLDSIKQKVENMGVFFEQTGLTPIHGRVFAYLLISDPPYRDFYEIQAFLQASKSAVSNALKYLTESGTVDYITFSGDRRRYFRVNIDGWMTNFKMKVRGLSTLKNLVEEVLAARVDSKHTDFTTKLEQMVAFQAYLTEGIEQLITTWDQKNRAS